MSDASLKDLYRLECSALPPSARVAAFAGREHMSELYRYSVGVLTAGEEIDLAAARGRAATFVMDHGGDEPLMIHGMIAGGGLRHAWGDKALYELVLVPKVWVLTLTHYCRIFVDRSVVDVLHQLLSDSGLGSDDYELRLESDYPSRAHTCQYKESRWAFLSRLMERAGLYYFFEQGDDREKLVVTDHRSFHQPLRERPARYIPLSGASDAMSAEAFNAFTSEQRVVPASVRLRDFDYLRPTLDVKAEAQAWPDCAAAQVHHGEHDFRSPDDGAPLARVAAEAWKARELTFRGRGRVFGLRAGYRFQLAEHPLASLDGEYLAVGVSHWGNQAADSLLVRELLGIPGHDDYHVEVFAIDAETQFRPGRTTPIPRISSVERAFIDGPTDSDYAQIDEHGRYKVKLHFDVDDSEIWDGEASTWLRMLQPHGGGTEGFHFPLRKNTEVLVLFLGGDPDRPVIAGAVPNAVQPSPVTADNHTQNVVQTGGASRIEIEDLEGAKHLDLYTPPKDTWIHLGVPHDRHSHYIVVNTEGNQLVNIGGNRDIEVGGPLTEHVHGHVSWTHDSGRKDVVTGGVDETYTAKHDTFVQGTRNEIVTGAMDETYGTLDTASGPVTELFASQATTISGTYEVIAGDTTLKFGTTGVYWGATSGKLASLNLSIPGGAEIITPSWKVVNPDETWLGASSKWTWAKKVEGVGLSISYTAAKVALVSGYAAAYGWKADACGFYKSHKGTEIGTYGSEAKTKGPSVEACATKIIP